MASTLLPTRKSSEFKRSYVPDSADLGEWKPVSRIGGEPFGEFPPVFGSGVVGLQQHEPPCRRLRGRLPRPVGHGGDSRDR